MIIINICCGFFGFVTQFEKRIKCQVIIAKLASISNIELINYVVINELRLIKMSLICLICCLMGNDKRKKREIGHGKCK